MTVYTSTETKWNLTDLMRLKVKDDKTENVYYLKPVNGREELYHIKGTTCLVNERRIRLEGDEKSERNAQSFLELKLGIKLIKNA